MERRVLLVVGIYAGFLAVSVGLLLFASFADPSVQDRIFPIAEKAFNLILGACIGALGTLVSSAPGR